MPGTLRRRADGSGPAPRPSGGPSGRTLPQGVRAPRPEAGRRGRISRRPNRADLRLGARRGAKELPVPGGHTIHRLARRHKADVRRPRGRRHEPAGPVRRGRGAAQRPRARTTDAWGKHLFHRYSGTSSCTCTSGSTGSSPTGRCPRRAAGRAALRARGAGSTSTCAARPLRGRRPRRRRGGRRQRSARPAASEDGSDAPARADRQEPASRSARC